MNQSIFIIGWQILYGFIMKNELVHGIKRGGGHDFLFKACFHRAFDSILWDHLDEALGCIGFSGHCRGLIYECLSTSKMMESFLHSCLTLQGLTVIFDRASSIEYLGD